MMIKVFGCVTQCRLVKSTVLSKGHSVFIHTYSGVLPGSEYEGIAFLQNINRHLPIDGEYHARRLEFSARSVRELQLSDFFIYYVFDTSEACATCVYHEHASSSFLPSLLPFLLCLFLSFLPLRYRACVSLNVCRFGVRNTPYRALSRMQNREQSCRTEKCNY